MKNDITFEQGLKCFPHDWDQWEEAVERMLRKGEANKACTHYLALLENYRAAGDRELHVAACLVRLAGIHMDCHRWYQATVHFQEGITVAQQVFGKGSVNLNRALRRYAYCLRKMATQISEQLCLPE
jgi:hypothetical protein